MTKVTFALLLLLPLLSFSQITTSNLSGKVKSDKGELVPHCSIQIIYLSTSTKYNSFADDKGLFRIYNANVGGPYLIRISAIGFKTYEKNEVYLNLGDNDMEFILEEETKQLESITISAKKTKNNAFTISEERLSSVPTLSRSIVDFTKLVPQSVNNSFAGTNFRYNNVTIDGTINNDAIGFSPSLGGQSSTSGMPGSSTRTSAISIDAIKDLQVYIAPYDVKIGNFLGGSINAITRSGTNKVEGSIYSFGRSNYGIKDGQLGFRLGFPIVKDKLFYFNSTEVTKRIEPVFYGTNSNGLINDSIAKRISEFVLEKYNYNVGSYDSYSIYSKSKKIFNRIDWNINENNQLTVRNNTTISEATNLERDVANFRFGSMDFRQNNRQSSSVIELRSRKGKGSNSFILGFTDIRDYRTPLSERFSFPQTEIAYNGGTIFIGNEREATIFNLKQKTYEVTNNFNVQLGNHSLLIGTHNEFYKIDYGFVNSWNGRISYKSLSDFYDGKVNRVRGFYGYETNDRDSLFNDPYAKFNINLYSAYVQDEITLGKLKISPGIRLDYTQLPSKPSLDTNVKKSFPYITNDYFNNINISPRLGFNYKINKNLTIRGGSGVFVGRIPFAWLGYAYYNDGIGFGSFDLNNRSALPNVGDPIKDGAKQFAFNNGQKNLTQTDLIQNGFKMPKVWRSNLAIDKTWNGYKFILEGIYTKTLNDLLFQQINIVTENPKYFSYDSLKQQPIYSGAKVNPNLSNAYLLSNTNKGYRYQLTISANKKYLFGLEVYGAYTYGIAKDVTNGIRNSMESNWQLNQSLTPNNPQLSYSNFDIRHRIVSHATYKIKKSQVSFLLNSQSGIPFTWGILNTTLANNPQTVGLVYIFKDIDQAKRYISNPKEAEAFMQYVEADQYLRTRKGDFTERNGGRTPWSTTVDIKLVRNVIVGKHKFQLTADIFNATNLLNTNWGKMYFVSNTFNSTSSVGLTRINSGLSDPLFTYKTPTQKPYSVDPINSKWQIQLGVRYIF